MVVDNGYTHEEAAKAMGVGYSTISKWVKQLREERAGKTPKASPMTPEQIEIRELKKKIERIELEKEILKKATALLMSDSLNNSNLSKNSIRATKLNIVLKPCAMCLGYIEVVINTGVLGISQFHQTSYVC